MKWHVKTWARLGNSLLWSPRPWEVRSSIETLQTPNRFTTSYLRNLRFLTLNGTTTSRCSRRKVGMIVTSREMMIRWPPSADVGTLPPLTSRISIIRPNRRHLLLAVARVESYIWGKPQWETLDESSLDHLPSLLQILVPFNRSWILWISLNRPVWISWVK